MTDVVRVTHPLHIGAIMRDRRRALGLCQKDLAAAAGVHFNWVIRMESGRPGIRISHLLLALTALDIDCTLVLRDDSLPDAARRRSRRLPAARRRKNGEAQRGPA